MRLTIGFGNIMANRTFPAGVSGVYEYYGNPGEGGFIFDKPVELVECPVAEPSLLRLSNRLPFPDICQVFERYCPLGDFGDGDDLLGYYMVAVLLKSGLPFRYLFKMPFCGFGSFLLEDGLEVRHFNSDVVYCFPGKFNSVRGGRYIDDTLVHADNILRVERGCVRDIDYYVEEKKVVFESKVRLAGKPFTFEGVVSTDDEWNFKPAGDGVDADGIKPFKRENPLVVNYGGMFLKLMDNLFIVDVTIGNNGDSPYYKLGGKFRKLFSRIVIAHTVERNLRKLFGLESHVRDVVAGFVEKLHGFYESFVLFDVGQEFYFYGKFHSYIIGHIQANVNLILKLKEDSHILLLKNNVFQYMQKNISPPTKAGGLHAMV